MHLDDFVFLGTAVPEESRRYGFTVCVAGFSPSLRSLLRLYPMAWPPPPSVGRMRWETYSVDLERPASDSRMESWKVTPADWSRAEHRGRFGRDAGIAWLRKHHCASIASLNDCRLSLGVLICPPRVVRLRGRYQACEPGSPNGHGQRDLWRASRTLSGPVTKARIPTLPILAFDDGRGAHELQLIDWGSVLLLHKGYDLDALADNLGIGDPTRAHLLLVGNQQNARTAWLVVACVPVEPTPAESEELSLFTWAASQPEHRSDA